ncbi:MAG: regulatory protein RecX [Desulfobacterales bacterium]
MTDEHLAKSDYQKAMNTAVRLLTRRDHTSFEILQKLEQRGFGGRIIERVLAECRRLDYIDDERTARIYIGQLARRGFGFRRIRLELRKKGLTGERFEIILNERRAEIDEREIARKVMLKKMKSFESVVDLQKRRDKIYRFLYSRGFEASAISELIREFVK